MGQLDIQYSNVRSSQEENRVLRERLATQEATLRSFEAECIQLRQMNRSGGAMFSSQNSMTDRKKLIEDNEKLVLQVSQLQREQTQAQNQLNAKENEFKQLPIVRNFKRINLNKIPVDTKQTGSIRS